MEEIFDEGVEVELSEDAEEEADDEIAAETASEASAEVKRKKQSPEPTAMRLLRTKHPLEEKLSPKLTGRPNFSGGLCFYSRF
ncbi:MAG: hypothetical protein CM15mP21_3990 [Hyphomicrobiales bacterium]|nr:MAG: hypothetical protein CM15mP21_3990 [Hyphomicrobiales bacterium]